MGLVAVVVVVLMVVAVMVMGQVMMMLVMSRSLVAPVPDNDGGTPDNLTFIALSVQLAKASIFAQLHVIRNSQKWDLMFLTQSLDQFLVGWLIAVLGQDAKQSLSLVKSFGGLMESSGKSILDQGGLEHFTESCFEAHATSEVLGSSTDGGCGSSSGGHRLIPFDVRHVFSLVFLGLGVEILDE